MVQIQTERSTVRVSSWVKTEATAATCRENTPPQLLAGSTTSYRGGGLRGRWRETEVLRLKIHHVHVCVRVLQPVRQL